MAVMKILLICGFLFIQLIHATTNHQDDGFAFEETETETKVKEDGKIMNVVPVHRVWGIPDTQTIVGKLFILQIPKDAFKGDVDHYEMVNYKHGGNREWPKWLEFDKSGIMKGVPLSQDVGIYYLTIIAVAPHSLYKSKDVFAIEVIKPGLDTRLPEDPIKIKCAEGSDPIMLTILLDNGIENIDPKSRVAMIENIAGYYGLSSDMFYLHEERSSQDVWSFADTLYFIAGPGHVNKTTRKDFASVSFQIGCGRKVDSEYKPLISKIKTEAADGTLSEVLMQPVIGWHAKNELPIYFRDRRQVGSGDLYEEDEEDEEDYNESVTTISTPHPHRHHHGEDVGLINGTALLPSEVQYQLPSISFQNNYEDLISTPAFVPGRPTLITESTVSIEPTRVTDFSSFSTLTTPNLVHEAKTDESSHFQDTTVPLTLSTSEDNITETTSDVSSSSSYGSTDQGTTDYLTTDSLKFNNIVSGVSTVTSGTTEEMEPRNFKPTIAHRLKKVAVTAGKVLRFKIPENTFADIEDGSTSHMSLKFKTQDGKPIPSTSWIKFDPVAQEIKALPLEEHVSKWEFEVEATDKDGDSVSDTFELQIQHHRGHRAVNFEFSAHLTLSNNWTSSVDWELKVIEALVSVYGDPDSNHITLRSVSQNASPVTFTWTNDTLPRSYCPRQEIDALMRVVADEDGDATNAFRKALEPDIFVKKVTMQGIGQCETKPEIPAPPPPQTPQENYSPIPRNQIDQVNATVGRLLVFKVPEDTFYDHEDGSTRNLKVNLFNMDRSPLEPHHWLQFDSKNQEFYGIPMDSDIRSQEYQLVCEDRQGLTANDGLIVVVFPRPKTLYSVEFSIALGVQYELFVNSPAMKRKFFDKLKEVFGDANTDAIVLGSISPGSTIVTWYNQTLRTDLCPDDDIQKIKDKLMNEKDSISDDLVRIMGPELDAISVGLHPLGACQGGDTVVHKPESPPPPIDDDSHPIGVDEDYLFTFVIPAVLIALMLILSGIVALLFYRKRRASKMGIGDEDEKQSFRNKGIPVIFQDELDEKPEPENKCPVIMKEEKPPLPPPEYQRNQHNASTHELNEDAPYQPPPPFTSSRDTGRNTRPKPTPTYRKPPPYVPP